MGRPPLHLVAVNTRLPEAAISEIDRLVGTYGRAKFIREAIENEIARRKAQEDADLPKPED